jgi:2-methylcitrate synthase
MSSSAPNTKGLAGITAGDSKVSTVGKGLGLNYRGYSIEELANDSTFEEVFYLLLFERLPSQSELDSFVKEIAGRRTITPPLAKLLELIPKSANAMDVMRTICSFLGNVEQEELPKYGPL